MRITSPAFRTEGTIPEQFTCEGRDTSPPLRFEDVPARARELVVVVEDRDAPNGTFTHWMVWNLDPNRKEIQEGASGSLGAREGTNDFGRRGWAGPCPPEGHGPHRYRFRLLAVDEPVGLTEDARRTDLDAALQGHVLEEATIQAAFVR